MYCPGMCRKGTSPVEKQGQNRTFSNELLFTADGVYADICNGL